MNGVTAALHHVARASMKALPKRKGNIHTQRCSRILVQSLNESPSQKEGKIGVGARHFLRPAGLNESPSEKEGKFSALTIGCFTLFRLNESPSEKEGKWHSRITMHRFEPTPQ